MVFDMAAETPSNDTYRMALEEISIHARFGLESEACGQLRNFQFCSECTRQEPRNQKLEGSICVSYITQNMDALFFAYLFQPYPISSSSNPISQFEQLVLLPKRIH